MLIYEFILHWNYIVRKLEWFDPVEGKKIDSLKRIVLLSNVFHSNEIEVFMKFKWTYLKLYIILFFSKPGIPLNLSSYLPP